MGRLTEGASETALRTQRLQWAVSAWEIPTRDHKNVGFFLLFFLVRVQLGQAEAGTGVAELEGTAGIGKRSRDRAGGLRVMH